MTPRHHRARHQMQDRLIRRNATHQLRRRSFITPTDENNRITWLGFNHLLCIHTHQVTQKHARRRRKRLMDTDGGKVYREPSRELHATLGGLDELRDVGMTWVEAGVSVDDADDGAGEGVVCIPQGFDEDFAEEEGEVGVAIGGEALAHAGAVDGRGEVVVFHGYGWEWCDCNCNWRGGDWWRWVGVFMGGRRGEADGGFPWSGRV